MIVFFNQKILIMISIFFYSFRGKCVEGCLKCEGNNVCSVCDAPSLYVMAHGECIKQSLEFCLLSFNLFSCLKCYPGFYLELNGKCVRNPEGANEIRFCKEYESYTRCKTCHQFYYLINDGQKCERISGSVIENCTVYESSTTCRTCGDYILSANKNRCDPPQHDDSKCMFYSNQTSCLKCNDGYFFDKNFYIKHIPDFYQYLITSYKNYVSNQNSVVNVPVCEKKTMIENCLEPMGNDKCQLCIDGYHINDNYDFCIEDPPEANFFRTDNITNCYLHNKTTIIKNNEEFFNIECILCYENYYKTVNNRKCMRHSKRVNNCKIMSQSTDLECILCENGYYRKNDDITGEKCLQRVDINANCAKYHLLSEACETCIDETYIKHYDEKYCSPPIPECKFYETSGIKLSCKQCNFGFYFDTENAQCVENDIFDPYCAYYNEKKECQECYFGFFYDTNRATPTCQPNTPEYVDKARCTEFHPLNKDECIGCISNSTKIKLQYTCKAFSTEVINKSDAFDYISFCNKYEIKASGGFKCLEAIPEVQHDNEDQKEVYALITDEERAYDVTEDKIQFCDLHENTYKTKSDPLKCKKCYSTRQILTDFDYDNVANISYCTENEIDSGYCVKFFSDINTCRTYTWYNIRSGYCPGFDRAKDEMQNSGQSTSDSEVNAKACPWRHNNEYSTNNCNISQNVKDYHCYTRDDSNNCNVYHFFRQNMGVRFSEYIEFEIVLSPDKRTCLQYNHLEFENTANCVQISDDGLQCLLCKKEYYSIPTRTFTYELDSIISYVSKTTDPDFVDGCIKYNDVRKLCELCAPGKYLSRNTCITCDGNNLAIDFNGEYCLQFVDLDFPNTCKRISVLGTTTYCIECKEGWVGKMNFNPAIVLPKKFYPIINSEETLIKMDSESLSFEKCVDSNDLFYYEESYKDNLDNCLFYQIYNDVAYCLGCKFGFTGELYRTPNDFLTVQNCVPDNSCDLSQTYPLKDPFISSLVTCHQCTDSSKIPTYNFFYTTAIDTDDASFIYQHSSNKTMNCEAPVISNCLIQLTTQDDTIKEKWNQNISGDKTICVYCKPKFTPTYGSTQDNYFPYRYITSCNPISDCESSLTPNQCEQCQLSGSNPDENNKRLKIDGEVSSCETNDYIASDPFCSKTNSISASGFCDECKDGYAYLNFKCIPLNVTSCKYFRGNTCVDSTKTLDENKSLIWREYNSDYIIKTINCVEIETQIENCEYYLTESTCHQCVEGFILGNNGKNCYQQNIENCTKYDDVSMTCVKCIPGMEISGNFCILSDDLDNLEVTNPLYQLRIRGCHLYSNRFCAMCTEENFYPVKIQLNQTSVCLNATIHQFCEEIDEELLEEEKILTCKKCKSMSSYQTVDPDDDFELSNYDFYDNIISDYSDNQGLLMASSLWDHYSNVRSFFSRSEDNGQYNPDVKFALFKYDYNICQEYTPIDNCLKYDDGSFEQTFRCIECTAEYFLNDKSCELRIPEDFCIEYYIDQNKCKRFVDTWDYSIRLSTFDNFVVANPPPMKSSSDVFDEGIEGCLAYSDLQTCRHCNSTTYLYDNLCLTVTKIVPECEIYSRDGLCTKCSGDLLLFQNKCLKKYSTNCDGYLSNTRCFRCPVEYPFLTVGSCKKNPDVVNCDQYANLNSCFYCNDAFSRTQQGFCELKTNYIPNCKKHLVGPFCNKCEENYVLINNQCIFNPNYDRNCKEFESTSECNVCQFNHYFKFGQCYPCKTDSFKCLFCDPDNPHQCVLCKSGFFMNNEKHCVPIPGYTQPLIKLYQESLASKNQPIFDFSLVLLGLIFLIK